MVLKPVIMPFEANISLRRWIKWGERDSNEPTTTLVLTSPQSRYVDIRMHLDHPQSPNAGSAHLLNLILSPTPISSQLTALEWGFAGTSARVPARKVMGRWIPARGIWQHPIDSRAGLEESAEFADAGDLYERRTEEGEVLELEKGVMVNLGTGEEEAYEEMWAPVAVDWHREDHEQSRHGCVVIELDVTGEHGKPLAKGLVIRVGSFCQGVVRNGNDVAIERWYSPALDVDAECLVRLGVGKLPCKIALMAAGALKEGVSLDSPYEGWKVVEVHHE